VVNPATACCLHRSFACFIEAFIVISAMHLWIFPCGKMGAVWLHSLLSQTVLRIAPHAFLDFVSFSLVVYHIIGVFILPNGYTVD
jgi:hypothetical protein